jgi:hypothetical protein
VEETESRGQAALGAVKKVCICGVTNNFCRNLENAIHCAGCISKYHAWGLTVTLHGKADPVCKAKSPLFAAFSLRPLNRTLKKQLPICAQINAACRLRGNASMGAALNRALGVLSDGRAREQMLILW